MLDFGNAGPEEAKNLSGAKGLRADSDPFSDAEFEKIVSASQAKNARYRLTDRLPT